MIFWGSLVGLLADAGVNKRFKLTACKLVLLLKIAGRSRKNRMSITMIDVKKYL